MKQLIISILILFGTAPGRAETAETLAKKHWESFRVASEDAILDSLIGVLNSDVGIEVFDLFEGYLLELKDEEQYEHYWKLSNALSQIYKRSDKSDRYLQLSRGNLDLALSVNDSLRIAHSYVHQGNVSRKHKLYPEAISQNTLALTYLRQDIPSALIAGIYNNLGMIWRSMGKPDAALQYQRLALEMREKLNDIRGQSASYNNIGALYSDDQAYEEARRAYRQALALKTRLNDSWGMANVLTNIALSYEAENNLDSASVVSERAEVLVKKVKSPMLQRNLYSLLGKLNQKKGNYKEALSYQTKYQVIKDSLRNSSVYRQLTEMAVQLESEKKQREYLEMEKATMQQLLNQKKQLIVMLVSLIILLSAVVILFRRKTAAERRQSILEQDKLGLEEMLRMKNLELKNQALSIAAVGAEITEESVAAQPESPHQSINQESAGVLWLEFDQKFDEVHGDFRSRLLERHPDLTPGELRVCSLLRLNMTSKDLAKAMSRSLRTIENTRYRIRKKLQLAPDEDLVKYIIQSCS